MRGDYNPNLTARELLVLQLVATGSTYQEVAKKLNLARTTVVNYSVVTRLKLEAKTIAHAVAIAKDRHLL